MTKISPQAQAVQDAASEVYWDWSNMSPAASHVIAAAALRAAADHVPDHQMSAHMLYAIADELEA